MDSPQETQQSTRPRRTLPSHRYRNRGSGHSGNWRKGPPFRESHYDRSATQAQHDLPQTRLDASSVPLQSDLNVNAQDFVPSQPRNAVNPERLTSLGKVNKPKRGRFPQNTSRNNHNTGPAVVAEPLSDQNPTDGAEATGDNPPDRRASTNKRKQKSRPNFDSKSGNTANQTEERNPPHSGKLKGRDGGNGSAKVKEPRLTADGKGHPERQGSSVVNHFVEHSGSDTQSGVALQPRNNASFRGGKSGKTKHHNQRQSRPMTNDRMSALELVKQFTSSASRQAPDVTSDSAVTKPVEEKTTRKNLNFREPRPLNPQSIESHREALTESLCDASYECMICCHAIKQETATWNCDNCYHVFHLYCIKKWANTLLAQSADAQAWRCPTCQGESYKIPNTYVCFCGKQRDPKWVHGETPHGCGEVCARKRNDFCTHNCNILCHPGACPPCTAYVSKHCMCRRSYQTVRCTQQNQLKCSLVCEKPLNCQLHKCQVVCHAGDCQDCTVEIEQPCFCGAHTRSVICGSAGSQQKSYSCDKICDKLLLCGNHSCQSRCHEGECAPCDRSPQVVTRCPCGKEELTSLNAPTRMSCLNFIPTCRSVCSKQLRCGPVGQRHTCARRCHEGPCACKLETEITCRCQYKQISLPCIEAMKFTNENPYLCDRKCTKKRACGKHKCGIPCCTLVEHPCTQVCGRRLTCGLHKCEEVCHNGKCPTCWHVSFDELTCHCGLEVIFPPIPCGIRPPECRQMCSRVHACEHVVSHSCHSEAECPPCVVLTTKLCRGGHELRNNIPCHMKAISCGKPCLKPLSCGQHKCPQICHEGDCEVKSCSQPCTETRVTCGHPCGMPCHPGEPCQPKDCRQKVTLRCPCGRRQEQVLCHMTEKHEKQMSMAALSLKMKELGTTIDITQMMKGVQNKRLDCNSECAIQERNARLASALEICDTGMLATLAAPQYSDFLKLMATKNPAFVAQIEKALYDLVKSAEGSKHQKRNHSFAPMKREERQVIHELAKFYGCETISYDEEPQRNVVATAPRDKCSLPKQSLTSFVQAEKYGKVPLPIPITATEDQLRSKSLDMKLSTSVAQAENVIDYFDMIS